MTDLFDNVSRVLPLLEKTARDSNRWDMAALNGADTPCFISFLNAHGVNTAVRNAGFFGFLMESDYLLRDGIGIKLALRLFGLPETENLNGTDLITKIILGAKNCKIAIFGASDTALQAAAEKLHGEGVALAAMEHGFHPDEFYLDRCAAVKPDIVVLCMGMPRQELLAAKMKAANSAPVVVCGGGWVDFYSGVKIRAPEWVRALSLEWLHRLSREPKRLGKRYTVDILYFFLLLALSRKRA